MMVRLSMKMECLQQNLKRDVVTFWSWAAEPQVEERKLRGNRRDKQCMQSAGTLTQQLTVKAIDNNRQHQISHNTTVT